MKELTIEEKAKAYDIALENAKHYHSEMEGDVCCVLEECFPQLKESEDSFELENKDNPNISLYASKSINWNKTEFISKPTIQMVLKEIKRRLNEWRFLSSIEAKYKYEAYSDLYEWVKQL